MPGAHTPTPQEVERGLKRLSPDQFAQVCGEVGILEVTLAGGTPAAKAASLVQRTQGHSDFAILVRAITRIEPNAWRPAPARVSIPSAVYGISALVIIAGLGGLALVVILSGTEPALAPTATPTETLAPTRTPVPTFTRTPTDTPVPSLTLTPTKTATRTPEPVTPTPVDLTDTPTSAPVVSIIYPQAELQQPPPNHRAYPSETVEFRWILRGVTLAADERYWMRLYLGNQMVDSYLTPDTWRYYVVPPGANGSFGWTVTVVKVDAAGNIVGPLSPESGQRTVVWQP